MSRLCAILLFAAAVTGAARAQGSGTVEVPDSINAPDSPFLVTRIAKGRIAGIKHDTHFTLVLIEDTKGRRGTLKVNSRTKFKADKGTEYAGKKHISPDDLEVGQSVKIIFAANSGQILELRLMAKT
jgi:hypothetical protein